MSDNLSMVWGKFFKHRTKTLSERFPGHYRAIVVETNDPLNIYRVRFKCPELHNFDLPAEDCPWAVPAPYLGGKATGSFHHPCIGDWVWITFEKQHPYGPIYTGFADPTRRQMYTLPQISSPTPLPLNAEGKPAEKLPQDYKKEYLPKDGRPMQTGMVDRYGNMEIVSAVGFYPKEHAEAPPAPDFDPLTKQKFSQTNPKPEINDPDKKYILKATKYGNLLLLGDQGYYWKKEDKDEKKYGEFTGEAVEDQEFEQKRWLQLQSLVNEDKHSTKDPDSDQRRNMLMTRYGHKFEMRDVGYAQPGPHDNTAREGEQGSGRYLSKETVRDQRWIKLRSKGGMLIELNDSGVNPKKDKNVQKTLLDEVKSEQELAKEWENRDSRFIRFNTRYGYKLVLDDRGSDKEDPVANETPRGNGILLKGRRSPGTGGSQPSGDPRGFFFQFIENDLGNSSTWGSPMGHVVELNDRYQYMLLSSTLGKDYSAPYKGLIDIEYVRQPAMGRDPEKTSHHLKLDHQNEYIRLKTRCGKGPKPENAIGSTTGENQGIEARDGTNGDGPWVELVDSENRGLWFSKNTGITVLRAKEGSNMYVYMDDISKKIAIYNNNIEGSIDLYCLGSINIKSGADVNIDAGGSISMRSLGAMKLQGSSTKLSLVSDLQTNGIFRAQRTISELIRVPQPGGLETNQLFPPTLPKTAPTDRGKTYNEPFEVIPEDEIRHPN